MAGWDIVKPIQDYWASGGAPLALYPAGSEGPVESDALLGSSGRAWRAAAQ